MTQLVGILNITPDSFSDGGQFTTPEKAMAHVEHLFNDGAALVDVGAESTRPTAKMLTPDEEWQRLEPILSMLMTKYPDKISLDSYHPETAERALRLGSLIVNDVTGMNNPEMVAVVAKYKPRVIISHLPGVDIKTAHEQMPVESVQQVRDDLLERHRLLVQKGLQADQIILDPGIGFGKRPSLNQELLRFAELVPGHIVMIGYSRKRFLGDQRMEIEPNLAAGRIAIAAGAQYLRVHDVAAHQRLIDSLERLD